MNEICRKTGFFHNKKPVTDAVRLLAKHRLMTTKKSDKHSQKRIKILTEAGKEVVKYIQETREYGRASIELRDRLHRIYKIGREGNKSIIRGKLEEEKWSRKDIESFDELRRTILPLLLLISPSSVVMVILSRYVSLLAKIVGQSNSSLVISILNQAALSEMSDHLVTISKERALYESGFVGKKYVLEEWGQVLKNVGQYGTFDHDFIRDDFRKIMILKLRALAPDDETIGLLEDDLKSSIEQFGKTELGLANGGLEIKKLKLLLELMNEAFKRNGSN